MQHKDTILKRLLDGVIVVVVRASSTEHAIRIVDAIRKGGVKSIEITMTVPGAFQVMEEVKKRFVDDVLLGAGTVLDTETARASISAGAEYIVSPCANRSVIEMGKRYGKVVMPGAMTPNEILAAWDQGADIVKIFPINRLGGPVYIKSIKEPFPQIPVNPSGGINLENFTDFLKAGASIVSVGSDLVDAKAVSEGRFETLTSRSRLFAERILSAQ